MISEEEDDYDEEEEDNSSSCTKRKRGPIFMKHVDVEKFLSQEDLRETESKISVFYDKERRFKRHADGLHLIEQFV